MFPGPKQETLLLVISGLLAAWIGCMDGNPDHAAAGSGLY